MKKSIKNQLMHVVVLSCVIFSFNSNGMDSKCQIENGALLSQVQQLVQHAKEKYKAAQALKSDLLEEIPDQQNLYNESETNYTTAFNLLLDANNQGALCTSLYLAERIFTHLSLLQDHKIKRRLGSFILTREHQAACRKIRAHREKSDPISVTEFIKETKDDKSYPLLLKITSLLSINN